MIYPRGNKKPGQGLKGKWKPVPATTWQPRQLQVCVRWAPPRLVAASPHTPGDTDISDRRPITEVIELRQSKEDPLGVRGASE